MPANENWARKIIQTWDPAYRPRWEVFDSLLQSQQGDNKICLEIGSGSSGALESAHKFKLKIHSDLSLVAPLPLTEIPFIQMNTYNLPIKNSGVDLILLRFVVEHLADPDRAFNEFKRILKTGGQLIVLTTNISSPLIFLSKILPYPRRKMLIQQLFKVQAQDVFPTYHRINRKAKVKKLAPDFQIMKWDYLQDANWMHRWWFLLFFSWHLVTGWLHVEFLRSNFIVLLKKM
jgi:SAM-dependent methyltransferase